MELLKITDFSLKNKRVLIRSDINVPIKEGVVTSDARIRAALPTIEYALNFGAKVMIASHLGRPKEGVFDDSFSLQPIVNYLKTILNNPIRLVKNWLEIPFSINSSELVLLENVRFNIGEKENSEALSKRMAAMCDIFVMDAFGAAHRAHASTCGVARFAPSACAGFLMSSEIENLSRALDNPQKPMVAIVGGAKVSTKLSVLQRLSSICDQIIPGGGIANTFLAASGVSVGKSLVEESFINQARVLLDKIEIPLPIDVIVATSVSENAKITQKSVTEVKSDEMILDIGPETSMLYSKILSQSRTILWNGPVGVFEIDRFSGGTKALAEAIARADVFSIAGGGDTIAALDKFGLRKQISYVSSGGGAFLEFVKGKNLPAIKMLEERSHKR